ncbi:unnamed protein product [Lathyrus sativus]|nr:unnamed protein product [Lathyrus sativus]
MELIDLLVVGEKFTWSSSSGSCRSRLDRFLISQQLINLWNIKAQYVSDRDISDDRPIWIKANNINWDPKPFKIFDAWYEHPYFSHFVGRSWNTCMARGSVAAIRDEETEILDHVSEVEMLRRSKAQTEMWNNLKLKDVMIKQKVRLKWGRDGDLNTKYFHSILNGRYRRNSIVSIKVGEDKVEEVSAVKGAIKAHFQKLFSSEHSCRPHLN